MQRREFAKNLLFGTGAVCTLGLQNARAALHPRSKSALYAVLARVEGTADNERWLRIERCQGDGCATPRQVRVNIEALGFPSSFRGMAIDAMFDTREGLRPFRVASFQPGQASPISKPLGFDADSAGLAGFRAELAGAAPGEMVLTSAALLSASRPTLAPGRYLLALGAGEHPINIEALPVPRQAGMPIVDASGRELPFAYLGFSVQPLAG